MTKPGEANGFIPLRRSCGVSPDPIVSIAPLIDAEELVLAALQMGWPGWPVSGTYPFTGAVPDVPRAIAIRDAALDSVSHPSCSVGRG